MATELCMQKIELEGEFTIGPDGDRIRHAIKGVNVIDETKCALVSIISSKAPMVVVAEHFTNPHL